MKKVLWVVIVGILLLICAVFIRTTTFTSKQLKVNPVRDISIDARQAAEHLAGAIRFQTVSHQNGGPLKGEEFLKMRRYLEQTFPRIHGSLTRETVADHSLLYTWKGPEAGLKPILLMAHLDVVPIEPGTESQWTHPPFEGRIAGGYIWGRGAWDNKASVMGILEAVEKHLGEGFQPRRPIYLAFGHDEEVGGLRGAGKMGALLQERGTQLEFILDEGGLITQGVVPGIAVPAALVGIAEKGFLSVELTVEVEGGHSSMPPAHTAIGMLSAAIRKLEDNQMPARISNSTRSLFDYLGPEMPYPNRLALANLWLLGPLVKYQFGAGPAGNAALRTTTAPTIIEAGVKENVLPGKARAVVNFRILPGNSIQDVMEHVRRTIANPRVKIARFGSSNSEPSFESDVRSPNFALLQRTISEIFSQTLVAPNLMVAGTDTKHYAKLSRNIYRFQPIKAGPKDLSLPHGMNERIALENYKETVLFYYQLIRNSAR